MNFPFLRFFHRHYCVRGAPITTDFLIVNEMDYPIQINYKMNIRSYISNNDVKTPPNEMFPARVNLEAWRTNFSEKDWKEIPSKDFKFDPSSIERTEFSVTVMPKEAVRLVQTSDVIYFQDGYRSFPLLELDIRGRGGMLSFNGAALLRQFTEKSYFYRFIAYR